MRSTVTLTVFCLTLVACSSSTAPPPPTAVDPAQKTVIDAQLKALQRAKDVQNVVDDQKKKQDKSVEDNGG